MDGSIAALEEVMSIVALPPRFDHALLIGECERLVLEDVELQFPLTKGQSSSTLRDRIQRLRLRAPVLAG